MCVYQFLSNAIILCPISAYWNSQVASKPFFSPTTLHGGGGWFSHGCSGCGRLGHLITSHLEVTRTPAFIVNQIIALVVFIWTIMALVLFILLSPILGVIALTILKTLLQVARMLEARAEAGKLDVVHIIIINEDGEMDVAITILVS
jgi:hypothetical protein